MVPSGGPWEAKVGYSRAVRVGNVIEVAGTTAIEGEEIIGKNDVYGQAKFIFAKIENALVSTGGSLEDVIRTRMYITDISRWEEAGQAHGEIFRTIKPVSTMVEVKSLIHPDLLIEIEATAIVMSDKDKS